MTQWLKQTARGVCMGIADVIPGVSGGTLALILGIYQRFIAAISAVGLDMLKAVFKREFWRRLVRGLKRPGEEGQDAIGLLAGHVLFLAFLAIGIITAVLIGARFIPDLLDRYPAQMKGLFLGLVAASVMIPYRHMLGDVRPKSHPAHVGLSVLFAILTFWIVGLPVSQTGHASGTVTLTFASPTTAPLVLKTQDSMFMTSTHGGANEKREVVFAPTVDTEIPAGVSVHDVAVRARMKGKVANLSANSLTVAKAKDLPQGVSVTNATATQGGVDPALWFLFMAGFIAISAMVLPGISGSFLLLVFGLYHFVTFSMRSAVYDRQGEALVIVAIFTAGMISGILIFSRALNWLLKRYHDATMAALAGIMVGSLRKLWPFVQTQADGYVANVLPDGMDGTVGMTAALCILGAVTVTLLERLGRRAKAA